MYESPSSMRIGEKIEMVGWGDVRRTGKEEPQLTAWNQQVTARKPQ